MAMIAAAPAGAQDWCAALQRIEAASREPVMFASLEGMPAPIPGYRHCQVRTGADGFIRCHAQLAPADLEASRVAERVAACLGIVPSPPGPAGAATRTFDVPPLRWVISSSCDERCQVGRVASFVVRRSRDGED
jgi:hypothetical protein